MAAPGERMKWGLVYTKPWNDEKKAFIESADTKCIQANYIKSVQNPDRYIVRVANIDSFFICLTRSGDGTHAKFDFEDTTQCDSCEPFNPFIEETIEGEELENDSERLSKSLEDEVQDKKPPADETEEQKVKREEEEAEAKKKKTFKMDRQAKLDKIIRKIHHWFPSCTENLKDKPFTKEEIKWKKDEAAEEIKVSPS